MVRAINPDKYKIPAFKRRASIIKKADKPLLLTALDRRRAGVPIVEKRERKKRVKYRGLERETGSGFDALLVGDFQPSPLEATLVTNFKDGQEFTCIGKMTHYFDRIQVGVIELDFPLRKGEYILFETENGMGGQTIDSMQYNKEDIVLARPGMDIGIKVVSAPLLEGKVYKIVY